jgi:HSP20 family protein
VQVDGNRLIISGQHIFDNETTSGRTVYSERSATEIFRSLDLPTDIDGSKVSAIVKDGLLKIELPKAPHAKSVTVEAKSAS